MRFKATPSPEPFSTRTVTKFALLPRKVENQIIWLERYSVRQFFGRCWRYWIDETGSERLL